MKDLIIVAHRGGHGPHPENSVEAFQNAIHNGVEAIEMDLRFDYFHKRFFVEHDFFHPPKKRQNTLETVIQALPKDIIVFAEIKTLSCLTNYLAKKTAMMFEKHFDPERAIIMSFNPFILMRLKKLAPKIPLGFICGKKFWNFLFQKFYYKHMKPDVYLLHRRLLNKKNVQFAKENRMQVIPFVINRIEQWEEASALDPDGVITDYPAVFQKNI